MKVGLVIALLCAAQCALAQPGTITTVAGGYPLGDGGPATKAAMTEASALAVDDEGNLFVEDPGEGRIRRIDSSSLISTIVGRAGRGHTGDNGPATAAQIYPWGAYPTSLAFDRYGALYYTDNGNHRIRRITRAGTITTFAGNGVAGFSGDAGPAAAAQYNMPGGLAIGPDDTIFVADHFNHRIRQIDSSGFVSTVVGTGQAGYGGDGGPASRAQIAYPGRLALGNDGTLYVCDTGNKRVRKVERSGIIVTFAGGGTRAPEDGISAREVSLPTPSAVAIDVAGEVYINTDDYVFKVTRTGVLRIVAGNGQRGATGDGGPAIAARLRGQGGGGGAICFDQRGNLYRSDFTGRVRRIDPAGFIDTIAGASEIAGDGGPAVFARVQRPWSVVADGAGSLYVLSFVYGIVRKITPDGRIRAFAGSPDASGMPVGPQTLPATGVALGGAESIALDALGNLLILTTGPSRVYRVTPEGLLSVFPGTDGPLFDVQGGPSGRGIAVDREGNVFVADSEKHRVLRVTPEGVISRIAGTGTEGFSGDGGPATSAQLRRPSGVAVDSFANVYIADWGNGRVRKVAPTGIITTVAGTGRWGFNGDGGPALSAELAIPWSVAADSSGNIYIGDPGVNRVRKVTPAGIITTIAGTADTGFSGDGGPATRAALSGPMGIFVDSTGNLLIADSMNHRVRRVQGSVPFVVEPGGLMFPYSLGALPVGQTVSLSVPERETRPFSVSASVNWLSTSPSGGASGSAGPISITVTANPTGLPKGTYTGRITITNPDTGEYVVVPVTMIISGSAQQLKLSPTAFTFATVAGAAAPPVQNLRVLNTGTGQMSWSVSTTTLAGGAGWLSATAPGVDVKVNPAGLKQGTYYGLVAVAAPGVDNSPQSAVVLLVVLPANQPPGPVVDPQGLIFTSDTSQKVQVSNISTRTVQFTSSASFSDNRNWFTYFPTLGTVEPGQGQAIEVRPNLANIPTGIYRGELTLKIIPDNTTVRVSLLLVVAPGTGKTAQRQADGCTPKQLLPLFRRPGEGFSSRAGWPESLQVEVVDDCKGRMNAGQVVVSFSNGDPAVSLTPVGEGLWTGAWASRNPKAAGVQLTARAEMAEPRLSGESKVTGGVRENPEQPLIAAGGVLNGASFRKAAPLAPGSYVSIFGTRLAKELKVAQGLPLPLELAETVALMAGRALPLHFASDGQVNGILPFGVADSTRQQLIVRKGLAYSPPEEVLVATSEPAVFTVDGSGSGQGHVYVATEEGLRLADAMRPAKGREGLVIYATGLGPVAPAVKDGEPAPAEPLAKTVSPITVTIQGKEAEVFYAGLAPGYAGLYQVNVLVPEGLKADASAQLIVSVGEQSVSPVVTIAVAGEEELQ